MKEIRNILSNQIQDNSIDIIKFIASLSVMAIHLELLGKYNGVLYPWLAFAVPIFFIISGYLFTMKVSEDENYFKDWSKKHYCQYIRYSVIFLPFVLYEWQKSSLTVFEFVRNVFWGRSIGAYWYIIAIIIGGGVYRY